MASPKMRRLQAPCALYEGPKTDRIGSAPRNKTTFAAITARNASVKVKRIFCASARGSAAPTAYSETASVTGTVRTSPASIHAV